MYHFYNLFALCFLLVKKKNMYMLCQLQDQSQKNYPTETLFYWKDAVE